MSDENTAQNATNSGQVSDPAPNDEAKPPWERDGEEFNPEKAWSLIQNLRNDLADAKTHRHQAATERDKSAAKTQELSDLVDELKANLQLSEDANNALQGDYDALTTLRIKEQILDEVGLPRKYAGNLSGDDEDAWRTSADELAELRGQGKPAGGKADASQNARAHQADSEMRRIISF